VPDTPADKEGLNVKGEVNWSEIGVIAGIAVPILGGIVKRSFNKLNAIGEHLAMQDRRGNRIEARMIRLETIQGLEPLPREDS
jgi:hypothetical protein